MLYLECVVLYPLAHHVLLEFHVGDCFQSHVVGPEDSGLIVGVQYRGGIGVSRRRDTRVGETFGEVARGHCELEECLLALRQSSPPPVVPPPVTYFGNIV